MPHPPRTRILFNLKTPHFEISNFQNSISNHNFQHSQIHFYLLKKYPILISHFIYTFQFIFTMSLHCMPELDDNSPDFYACKATARCFLNCFWKEGTQFQNLEIVIPLRLQVILCRYLLWIYSISPHSWLRS